MSTHTLTALFSDPSTAEQAAERLRAIGVPEASLDVHPETTADMPPAAGVGILDLADPLLPRDGAAEAAADARTVLVATQVPGDLASEARSILRAESVEVDDERDGD
jgi:hypothetical protein